VGISPIAYRDPRVWPRKDAAAYRNYVERLAGFTRHLAAAGRRVVLFSTDGPDRLVMEDVWTSARRPDLVERARTESLSDLFAALAQIDVVIASRLHGVILAQLAGCPVVALSYDWKVAKHMEDIGQSAYCQDIDEFDIPSLSGAVARLERQPDTERTSVEQRLDEFRSRVRRQFEQVLR
jgi:polysaccharide pyruvyl transferase WcaK-like protein